MLISWHIIKSVTYEKNESKLSATPEITTGDTAPSCFSCASTGTDPFGITWSHSFDVGN